MTTTPHLLLGWLDWLHLFSHFLTLSLLSIGGVVTTLPDMERFLVQEQHWISAAQFASSVALGQVAPGPNVLFVALMGWNVGLNTGSLWAALFGSLVAMAGILLPSATLTYFAANWAHKNRDLRVVRAFKTGMGPIVIALLIATGWILIESHGDLRQDAPLWALVIVSTLLAWRSRVPIFVLLLGGAMFGWFVFA
jgi:chromate transporter